MDTGQFMDKINTFSRSHILNCPGLGRQKAFPRGIWAAMGGAGILDPEHPALAPSPCLTLANGAETLVETGGNLGLALSWTVHHLTARFLVRPHLDGLADAGVWDRVRTGASTLAFAVSEPHAGAHPKFMTARADPCKGAYGVSGKKTYLTNGPIADGFVVIAITRENRGRKYFSAFFLDRKAPGLTLGDPLDLPFFHPASHGSIEMAGCPIDKERLLGEADRAWSRMVLPFKHLEKGVMSGAISGAMGFILNGLGTRLSGTGPVSRDRAKALGGLGGLVTSARYLSRGMATVAQQIHDRGGQEGQIRLEGLGRGFTQMVTSFLEELDPFLKGAGSALEDPEAGRVRDLVRDLGAWAGMTAPRIQ